MASMEVAVTAAQVNAARAYIRLAGKDKVNKAVVDLAKAKIRPRSKKPSTTG
jgi:hypothetical protein